MPKRDRWSSEDEEEGTTTSTAAKSKNDHNHHHHRVNGHESQRDLPPRQQSQSQPLLTSASSLSSSSSSFPCHHQRYSSSRSVHGSYTRLSHIDSGTYGIVWKAKKCIENNHNNDDDDNTTTTTTIVALKQMKFDNAMTKEGFPISALREINVLLALQHPNIVKVNEVVIGGRRGRGGGSREGSYPMEKDDNDDEEDENGTNANRSSMEPPQVYMVMECLEMDLQRAMKISDPSYSSNIMSTIREKGRVGILPFAQSEVKFLMHQLLSAIQHIHSNWYLHRDVKTSNILLRRNGHLVLCDFGLARKYEEPARAMTMSVVTLWYRAPELLFGECKYGPGIDMWSVGCIFGELLIKDSIFQGNGELDQIQQIFKLVGPPTETSWPSFSSLPSSGIFKWRTTSSSTSDLRRRFSINSSFSSTACQTYLDSVGLDLFEKLLRLDPARRINASDALSHEYFTGGVKMHVPEFSFA